MRRTRPAAAAGGGGADGFSLLATFIEAAAGRRWDASVVTGPHCAAEPARRLRDVAAEPASASRASHRRSARGSAPWVRSCAWGLQHAHRGGRERRADRLRSARAPAPRAATARAFARRGLLSLVEPEALHAESLRDAIESALRPRLAIARGSLELGGAASGRARGRPQHRARGGARVRRHLDVVGDRPSGEPTRAGGDAVMRESLERLLGDPVLLQELA